MTAIWQNDGSGWHLLSLTGFPNEEKLHTLVEEELVRLVNYLETISGQLVIDLIARNAALSSASLGRHLLVGSTSTALPL
jgi:hypothetical protein